MSRHGILAFAALFIIALSIPACASVSMWFADGAGAALGDSMGVAPGADFTVSIYMDTTDAGTAIAVAVAFDTADTFGLAAVPLDGMITLKNNSPVSFAWSSSMASDYIAEFPALVGGFVNLGPDERPYGVCASRAVFPGDPAVGPRSNAPVCTITFTNLMSVGEAYDLRIWDGGEGDNFTSFLQLADDSYARGFSDVLRVTTVVPEPCSLTVFVSGVSALFAFARRPGRLPRQRSRN